MFNSILESQAIIIAVQYRAYERDVGRYSNTKKVIHKGIKSTVVTVMICVCVEV